MTFVRRLTTVGMIVVMVGCSGGTPNDPIANESTASPSGVTDTSSAPPTTLPLPPLPGGLRYCGYIPGATTTPEHADVEPFSAPTPEMPANTAVSAETTARQLAVLDELSAVVPETYIDPLLNGNDWPATVQRYRDVVTLGLTDADFNIALDGLISELGDGHSHIESPAEVAESAEQLAGDADYVGIGVFVQPIFEVGGSSIIVVFPGSPAERAGLRAHDTLLAVDGQPAIGVPGEPYVNPFRGPEGTTISIAVSHPGGATETVEVTRGRVEDSKAIDLCVVPGTRILYVLLPGLSDSTLAGHIESALTALADGGPLDGVVVDNRLNHGGSSSVLEPILSLFAGGDLGEFRDRHDTRSLTVEPNDVNGSQTVPMVVLVGANTVSYGEVMAGVLQAQGRAIVIGSTTRGNVETLNAFDLDDGSRLWLAAETFEAAGATYGPWEETGIIPDFVVSTRWDLFDETNDPALAAAVAILIA